MRKLNIIGAFDRNNYGDILFPTILTFYLKNFKTDFKFQYVGIRSFDLRNVNGFKTISMRKMFWNSPSGSVYIIAGGEVLGAPWYGMLLSNVTRTRKKIFHKIFTKVNFATAQTISKIYYWCWQDLPWLIERKRLRGSDQLIIYNAVGGSSLLNLTEKLRNSAVATMKAADYISVRDQRSLDNVAKVTADKFIQLFPDSGMLVSKVFNEEVLINNCRASFIEQVMSYGEYVIFQVGMLYTAQKSNSVEIIIEQLASILEQHPYKIILLPLGLASNHEDDIPLQEIKNGMYSNRILYLKEELRIHEIAFTIKHAKAYIGSSLHGNITAISYAVPAIGLTYIDLKLPSFLETWMKGINDKCYDFSEIEMALTFALTIKKEILSERRATLIKLATENIENICSLIDAQKNRITDEQLTRIELSIQKI